MAYYIKHRGLGILLISVLFLITTSGYGSEQFEVEEEKTHSHQQSPNSTNDVIFLEEVTEENKTFVNVQQDEKNEKFNEDFADFSSSQVTLPSASQNNEMNYTQNGEKEEGTFRKQRRKSRCCKCSYDEDKACCFLEICMVLCKCLISIVGDDD